MTGKLNTVFDSIHAEDNLKKKTLLFLHSRIKNQQATQKTQSRALYKSYAVAAASIAVLFISALYSYHFYFTPGAFVDVDINPSIALTLNRFDRVIEAQTYNMDGEDILSALSLTHKTYGDALVLLMEAVNQQGYLQKDAFVSVTVQTDDSYKENKLLTGIQTGVEDYMAEHHHTIQTDVFVVSGETRRHAHDHNISPAKYMAIQELIETDPTATINSCREHSISEIKQQILEHNSHHENVPIDTSGDPSHESCEPFDEIGLDSETKISYHEGNSSDDHHGNGHD